MLQSEPWHKPLLSATQIPTAMSDTQLMDVFNAMPNSYSCVMKRQHLKFRIRTIFFRFCEHLSLLSCATEIQNESGSSVFTLMLNV